MLTAYAILWTFCEVCEIQYCWFFMKIIQVKKRNIINIFY